VSILSNWIKDANEKDKSKMLASIIKVLEKLPITLACLKSSEIAIVIKGLTKTLQSNESKYYYLNNVTEIESAAMLAAVLACYFNSLDTLQNTTLSLFHPNKNPLEK
jgi:hypothetical protein